MLTLRLTEKTTKPECYHVEIAVEGDDLPRLTADAEFEFKVSAQEREDMRWYFEDYLTYPLDPAPAIAARVEHSIEDIGTRLFDAVFKASEDTRNRWKSVADQLDKVRLEIASDVEGAASLPWELMFDPFEHSFLVLRAGTFVRTLSTPARIPKIPRAADLPIRILLVICRPGGRDDVPFRSVANRIISGLGEDARKLFQLDVLRPPTFERLSEVLQTAKSQGHPYHVVHFDGHGGFIDAGLLIKGWTAETDEALMKALEDLGLIIDRTRFSPEFVYPHKPREGRRGYLLFENPRSAKNVRLVDGPELGKLLADNEIPLLVLNACRSSYAEPPSRPVEQPPDDAAGKKGDVHTQVRAFGSLAQEVMDAGVGGVVAMRYNVYVVTAANFMTGLYASLIRGQALSEGASVGRRQLAHDPMRAVAYDPRPLQDWSVPVVYEAKAFGLFPKRNDVAQVEITLKIDSHASRGQIDPELDKRRPDAGFFGRDETLLALDRAFDPKPDGNTQNIVLLHAYAGSGKTTTAVEFARWYAQTGGLDGPVLFTAFEVKKTLPQVLDTLGRVFEQVLEANKIPWLALTDAQRRGIALAIMQQIPILWIWPNVEPIAGFPTGTPSMWTEPEQKELADFLRAARETKSRFLLTSRRDERAWLGDLPTRLTLPPMPMQERVQLARALADKARVPFTQVQDWRPLLDFTQGNPLTITVVVGQALREGITTHDQIATFLSKLRAGETTFADEQTEGRSKSLGASLSYGFTTAFTQGERKVLALLHFFQGFVDVNALRQMGSLKNATGEDYSLPEVRGLTRETGIALLDRAAEVGLLTAHGDGYYSIHPALPWYFNSLFQQYYPDELSITRNQSAATSDYQLPITDHPSATRAFVEALGELSNYYHDQYIDGNSDVIAVLEREEDNLLYARRLARQYGWWLALMKTMQGLHQLYDHTGRRAEWQALVDEIVPDFVDAATDGPRPGREEQWSVVTQYRVWLANEARQWAEAERLQRTRVDWNRRRAAPYLPSPSLGEGQGEGHADLSSPTQGEGPGMRAEGRNTLRTLAASLALLGDIQREQSKPDCVTSYEEAADLLHHIGDRPAEAIVAFNLGHTYKDIPALRDLAQAERWYRRSLELRVEGDRKGQGGCYAQLGLVAYERFNDVRGAKRSNKELARHLNEAVGFYQQALQLLPPNAVDDLTITHNALGVIFAEIGDLTRALPHYRESIRYAEVAGNFYEAGTNRTNVAIYLANAGRFEDALLYAQAALRNFATYGDRAAADIQKTQGLIGEIEKAIAARGK